MRRKNRIAQISAEYQTGDGMKSSEMRRWSFLLVRTFIIVFFTACASSPLKDFSRVKRGMDKDDVLDIVGSPHHKNRVDDSDIWGYTLREGDHNVEKEIYLKGDRVIYVGDKLTKDSFAVNPENSTKENSEDSSSTVVPGGTSATAPGGTAAAASKGSSGPAIESAGDKSDLEAKTPAKEAPKTNHHFIEVE